MSTAGAVGSSRITVVSVRAGVEAAPARPEQHREEEAYGTDDHQDDTNDVDIDPGRCRSHGPCQDGADCGRDEALRRCPLQSSFRWGIRAPGPCTPGAPRTNTRRRLKLPGAGTMNGDADNPRRRTFCMSDEVGDITAMTHGLFDDDTRMLSRLPPARSTGPAAAPHLPRGRVLHRRLLSARNAPTAASPRRHRLDRAGAVHRGDGMTERIALRNEGMAPVSFPVEIELGADFADILSVKSHDFSFGDPAQAALLPAGAPRPRRSTTSMRIDGRRRLSDPRRVLAPRPAARPRRALRTHARAARAMGADDRDQLRRRPAGAGVGHGAELRHRARARARGTRGWKLRVPRLTDRRPSSSGPTSARSPTWRRSDCGASTGSVSFRPPACRGS